jgi:hypothetical protein
MHAMISPIMFLFHSHYVQPKRYPLRFLAPNQVCELPTGFSSMVPPKPLYMQIFYMFLVLQLKPPLGIISLQHQPFISLNSNQNTEPAMM